MNIHTNEDGKEYKVTLAVVDQLGNELPGQPQDYLDIVNQCKALILTLETGIEHVYRNGEIYCQIKRDKE